MPYNQRACNNDYAFEFLQDGEHGNKKRTIKEAMLIPPVQINYNKLTDLQVELYNGTWCKGGYIATIDNHSLHIKVRAKENNAGLAPSL